MPRIHSHLPQDSSPFGSVGENSMWGAIDALYLQDRLQEAHEAVLDLGTGVLGQRISTYRMIEAEYLTRFRSVTEPLNQFISIEFERSTVDRDLLFRSVEDAMDEVTDRLGVGLKSKVLATVWVADAETPWTPGRHGFCIAKNGFAKVCLPAYLLKDPNELQSAFRHEFSHALAAQETEKTCRRWLDEAIAMQMGEGPAPQAQETFQQDPSLWKDPAMISIILGGNRQTKEEQRAVWIAYQQAALIARYLVASGSERSLGLLLRTHRQNFFERFVQQLMGGAETDRAIMKVNDLTVEELFDQALISIIHR